MHFVGKFINDIPWYPYTFLKMKGYQTEYWLAYCLKIDLHACYFSIFTFKVLVLIYR